MTTETETSKTDVKKRWMAGEDEGEGRKKEVLKKKIQSDFIIISKIIGNLFQLGWISKNGRWYNSKSTIKIKAVKKFLCLTPLSGYSRKLATKRRIRFETIILKPCFSIAVPWDRRKTRGRKILRLLGSEGNHWTFSATA